MGAISSAATSSVAVIRNNLLTDGGGIGMSFSEVCPSPTTSSQGPAVSACSRVLGEIAWNRILVFRRTAASARSGRIAVARFTTTSSVAARCAAFTAQRARSPQPDHRQRGDGVWWRPRTHAHATETISSRETGPTAFWSEGDFGFLPDIDMAGNIVTATRSTEFISAIRPAASSIAGNRIDRNGDDGIDVDNPRRRSPATTPGGTATSGSRPLLGTLGGGNWAKHNGNPLQCVPGSLCSTTGKPKN